VVIIAGGIDLSVGSIICLTACTTSYLTMVQGFGIVPRCCWRCCSPSPLASCKGRSSPAWGWRRSSSRWDRCCSYEASPKC
jgi:ribose/xylose/arabinose/galactoside ABC-type transport system permease subunit